MAEGTNPQQYPPVPSYSCFRPPPPPPPPDLPGSPDETKRARVLAACAGDALSCFTPRAAVPPVHPAAAAAAARHACSYYPGDLDEVGIHSGRATRPAPAALLLWSPLAGILLLLGLSLARRDNRLERGPWAAATAKNKADLGGGGGLRSFGGASCRICAIWDSLVPSAATRVSSSETTFSSFFVRPVVSASER